MPTIFTYKNLYRAYLDCRKHKRKTANALKFEYNLEENLLKLLNELRTGTYSPGRSIRFIVIRPKPREIFAADFRDRVVHHLLVSELLLAAERRFIHDSYACRPGKGTHRAVGRLKKFIRSAGNKNEELHYLQLDIKTFFPSIDQKILFNIAERLIYRVAKNIEWAAEVRWLAKKIIFHNAAANYYYKGNPELKKLIPPEKSLVGRAAGKGLPIGNYTSQFFANLYLNELDQFIKRELKCKHYVRYVDDLVMLGADRSEFDGWIIKINDFLKNKLALKLNEKKIRARPVASGIDFLGYFIKADYVLVRRAVVRRLRKRLFGSAENREQLLQTISSYMAHFKHADSWKLRTKIVELQLAINQTEQPAIIFTNKKARHPRGFRTFGATIESVLDIISIAYTPVMSMKIILNCLNISKIRHKI